VKEQGETFLKKKRMQEKNYERRSSTREKPQSARGESTSPSGPVESMPGTSQGLLGSFERLSGTPLMQRERRKTQTLIGDVGKTSNCQKKNADGGKPPCRLGEPDWWEEISWTYPCKRIVVS